MFAIIKEIKAEVDFSFSSPDFICNNGIVIEATTANHLHDNVPEWEKTISGITEGNSFDIFTHSAIRLSNALTTKVNKYRSIYSHLEYVKDKPFIIAISNYTRQDFNLHGDVPLQWLLYDVLEKKSVTKKSGGKIDLGIFRSDAYKDVSAILYSSLATFGKARVLGDDVGNITCKAIRIKNNFTSIKIEQNISEYKESLTDGLRLFLNPFATVPLNLDIFIGTDIRIFVPDKIGNLNISCHEDGDLCMRFINSVFLKNPIH